MAKSANNGTKSAKKGIFENLDIDHRIENLKAIETNLMRAQSADD